MAEVVIMPKLGFNMDEGQLVKWHKQVGETVKKGEVLFEINTDKTTMPVEATEDGTLLKIILEEGAFAEVFTPIAVTGAPGEDPDAALASAGQGQAGGSAPAAVPSAPAAPVDMKSLKLTRTRASTRPPCPRSRAPASRAGSPIRTSRHPRWPAGWPGKWAWIWPLPRVPAPPARS